MPRALSDFVGHWRIARDIDDAKAQMQARFEGTAVLSWQGDDLAYAETGALQMPGAITMQAQRRYLWSQEGPRLCIFFDDGRPFHHIELGTLRPKAHHDCPPDVYDVTYDFSVWPHWCAQWRVQGPRKDYVMRSEYSRI
ncbi:DUF6314 family protein [Roseobacteraceae bacterium S113]